MDMRRQMLLRQISDSPEIPPEYKRIRYLESSGTQYIYTDVPAKSGIECQATVMWLSANTGDQTIFGARLASSNRLLLVHQYPYHMWTLGYDISHTNLGRLYYGIKYRVAAKTVQGEQYLKIDGETIYTGTSNKYIDEPFNMSLFACTYGSASVIRLFSTARIYELSATMDGVPALNIVPCIRKADGKPGMYDLVNSKFYINDGDGEFIIPA